MPTAQRLYPSEPSDGLSYLVSYLRARAVDLTRNSFRPWAYLTRLCGGMYCSIAIPGLGGACRLSA